MSPLSSELELPLMEILWTKGSMKGRDLYDEIRATKKIAYTTALTVLDRLSKKGFIRKDRESGTILFTPAVSRADYQGVVTGDLLRRAFEVSPDLAVSAFTDIFSEMRGGETARLEAMIEKKRHEKERG
jgi:BlaI family transcriptional regulator, penicillinase repressor